MALIAESAEGCFCFESLRGGRGGVEHSDAMDGGALMGAGGDAALQGQSMAPFLTKLFQQR